MTLRSIPQVLRLKYRKIKCLLAYHLPKEISQIAQKVTVKISNINESNQGGSGVIVNKEGNLYTVLTNCHVLAVDVEKEKVGKKNIVINANAFRLFPNVSNKSDGYELKLVSDCEWRISSN